MDAIEKIHEFDCFGSILGLERMNVLLEKLGNPQQDLKAIHVAGTNGKGSVCKFIYEALKANGYKVGLYTSPFIQSFNERIQLDGAFISDQELETYTAQAVEKAEEMVKEGLDSPTEFEVVTAVAFLFFAARGADFVILEVGLGGSGDSTNVIEKPLISIITSISYDHMDRLGDTLAEIAGEKAGIIKEGVPVVSNVEQPEAAAVIAKKAYEKGCILYDATKLKYGIREESAQGYAFDMEIYGTDYSGVRIGMAGRHQVENAKTALIALEILRKQRIIKIRRDKLYEGMQQARQPGRFEVFEGDPCVVLDGAHNEAGAAALRKTVETCFPQRRIVIVTGMLADKETDKITDELRRITDQFIVSEPDNPRKMDAEALAGLLTEKGAVCKVVKDARAACRAAMEHQSCPEVVVCAGSLYLIGEIRGMFS
ncbi:bifunctional folylpolyglutamate synthase/dihydrofolate synthase [Anaerovorax odorimutans]|uniref:tetrahydrofolate synthase n=1 Tax=Anaerovorax odorimutans TaxID=109327 RepID=A0ABT1RS72_9FIRM|nr:folylpolyglutamate synthase/dihydrofolate synthase family protein [Anaerovorax odorimutans]MCQ4638062.1 bifunctional folylpolyglutamate synthase/dihydrofolate synthase [Anaerovorax odorimutans]